MEWRKVKTIMTILILFLILFIGVIGFQDEFTSEVTAANAIYVDKNGHGNYTSIQAAIDNATAGDTIYVWAGTYYENVVVNKTVSIIGNGSANTTIDGGGTGDVVKITADWVNLSGFKIQNSGKVDDFPIFDSGIKLFHVENVTIMNNNCTANGYGICPYYSNWNVIENNTCYKNKLSGIILNYSNLTTIKNNTCNSNSQHGIVMFISESNLILNNFCNSNTGFGIQCYWSNSNTIENNICRFNDWHGISSENSDSTIIVNNTSEFNGFTALSCGIIVSNSDLNIIINNTCNNNTEHGIALENSKSNTILNNSCSDNNRELSIGLYSNRNKNNARDATNAGIALLSNSDSNIIYNNKCFKDFFGIGIQDSRFNTVKNNICYNNLNSGILLIISKFNIIENNTCNSNNVSGISIDISESNTVSNNSCFLNNVQDILIMKSVSIIVSNNKMNSRGLCLDSADFDIKYFNTHTIDTANIVKDNPVYYWKDRTSGSVPTNAGQIILANCSNVQIYDQAISNACIPIELAFSNLNNISNNTITNNFIGIYIVESNNNNISNNHLNQNEHYGINIRSSIGNTIFNNTCNQNDDFGIVLTSSKSCTISSNNASGNGRFGILLLQSQSCSIMNNDVHNNAVHGIYLNLANNNLIIKNNIYFNKNGTKINNSRDNRIYYNNFIDNKESQAFEFGDSRNNEWDNGYCEGNYWSDYTGLDNGADNRVIGDGIGDTKIPHLDLDRYPFINHSGWLYPGLPKLFDPGELNFDGKYIVTWLVNRGATKYVLEEDINNKFGSPTVIYNGSKSSYNVYNKPNGTYYYRLKSIGENFESVWSNTVDIIVDWLPVTPQNFSISIDPEGNRLDLSWNLNTDDIKEYEIYFRNRTYSSLTLLTSILHPQNSFSHSNLNNGEIYYYKIKAKDARGLESGFTKMLSEIPFDSTPPLPPTGLKVIETKYNSIELIWNQSLENDVKGYNIYRGNISNFTVWGDLIGTQLIGEETFIDKNLEEYNTYYYTITAYDEVPNESEHSIIVSGKTKLRPHKPEINNSLKDFSIDEDSVDNSTINLYHWFKDLNKESLIFKCERNEYINVTIFQENGTVILRPVSDWHGREKIIFYASDGELECFDDVKITVEPINDPPQKPRIIEPKNNGEIYSGSLLNFVGECHDVDLPEDDLKLNWSSDLQGELGSGEKLRDIELVPGVHNITLNVTDLIGECSIENITVIVLENIPPPKEDQGNLYLMSTVFGVTIVILLLILFFFIKRKEKLGSAKAKEPTISRFSFLSMRVSHKPKSGSDEKSIQRDTNKNRSQKLSSSNGRKKTVTTKKNNHMLSAKTKIDKSDSFNK